MEVVRDSKQYNLINEQPKEKNSVKNIQSDDNDEYHYNVLCVIDIALDSIGGFCEDQ
jgi:hypothetical protein